MTTALICPHVSVRNDAVGYNCPKCKFDITRTVKKAVKTEMAKRGAKGGKAATGAKKARSSEQARAAINARW